MNGEDKAITQVVEREEWLSVKELRGQLGVVQQLVREIMVKDEDYGVIPGCKKPSLWQPGAEKLGLAFRLVAKFSGEREPIDLGNGHREYVIKCELFDLSGRPLGDGFGSCSTMESKYRYRGGIKESTGKPVPKEYWNLREANPTEAQKLIGGPGFGTMKGQSGGWEICELGEKMENPDIADCWNTVLQIARKRSFVATVKTRTAASNFFTMDVDNRDEDPDAERYPQAPMQMPQEKPKAPAAEGAPAKTGGPTPAQKKFLLSNLNELGIVTDEQRHSALSQMCDGEVHIDKLSPAQASFAIDILLGLKKCKGDLKFDGMGLPVITVAK